MPDTNTSALGIWMMDDYNEAMDLRETDAGVTQVRMHAVAQRHCQIKAEDAPDNLDVGLSQQTISFNIGPVTKTYDVLVIGGTASTSTDRWVCVGDGLRPYQHPSDITIRTQTWEYFSKYIDAPAGWNGGTPA